MMSKILSSLEWVCNCLSEKISRDLLLPKMQWEYFLHSTEFCITSVNSAQKEQIEIRLQEQKSLLD